MKKTAIFALFFAFLLSLNFLQPSQGGELEVLVKDKGTGKPIAKARMVLWRIGTDTDRVICDNHYYGDANERGIGVFNNLPVGRYFLACEAPGYASEPSLFVMKASGVISAIAPPEKKFRSRQAILDALKVFSLGENESKKMELPLEAGGAIQGLLRQVGCAGVSVLRNQSFFLGLHVESQDPYFTEGELESEFLYADEDGLFKVDGLKAGDRYFLRVQAPGYLPAVIEGIRVESGRTTRLDADVCSSREPSPSSGINSLALSADGEWLAWGGPFSLYTARTSEFPKFREFPLERMEFATESMKFSGDGKFLFAIGRHGLYRAAFSDGVPKVDACFANDRLGHFQLRVSQDGSRVWTSLDGPDTPVSRPGWRAAVQLDYVKGSFEITRFVTPAKSRNFLGTLAMDGSDRLYYSYDPSYGMDPSGTDSLSKNKLFRMTPSGQEKLFWQEVSGLHFMEVALTGDRLLFYGEVNAKDRAGNPLITLFISDVASGVAGKPRSILLPHEDPISWGACFSPDGRNILWLHLVRGNDGDKIVRQEIRICRYEDGHWGPQEILFVLPDNDSNWSFTVSRRNLVIVNTQNEIYFYPSLLPGQKPILLKAHIKPYTILYI